MKSVQNAGHKLLSTGHVLHARHGWRSSFWDPIQGHGASTYAYGDFGFDTHVSMMFLTYIVNSRSFIRD